MAKCVRILALALLVAGCGAGPMRQAAFVKGAFDPKGAGDFKFVVMGDNRPQWKGGDAKSQNENLSEVISQSGYFRENIRAANALAPEFVVITGDLVHGYTTDRALLAREWEAYDDVCKLFRMPLVSVVGNHDIFDWQSQDVWHERLGPQYFSWDHKGCHFIALSSEIRGQTNKITGAQLEWLKKDLKTAAGARRIFVFLHAPLWDYGLRDRLDRNQWNREVHPLLAAAGVDTVFVGHRHEYMLHPTRDGVRYVVAGGAGAELRAGRLAGGFYHIMEVRVAGSKADLALVTPEGRLPTDAVTVEKVEALREALQVEPLQVVTSDGDAFIRVRVPNLTAEESWAVVTWDTKGTAWQAEKSVVTPMPPSGDGVLELQVRIRGPLMPLPSAKLDVVADDGKMFSWNLLNKAIQDIAPQIREWNVVGPFDLGLLEAGGDEAMKQRYLKGWLPAWSGTLAPERNVNLAAAYWGKGGKTVRWEPVKAEFDGLIDFDGLYKSDNSIACAASYIYSPRAARRCFSVGSDDSIMVRINGREVWRKHAMRGAKADEDTFQADLRQGWNEVFVKVASRNGGWGFYFRVLDVAKELKFALRPGT